MDDLQRVRGKKCAFYDDDQGEQWHHHVYRQRAGPPEKDYRKNGRHQHGDIDRYAIGCCEA